LLGRARPLRRAGPVAGGRCGAARGARSPQLVPPAPPARLRGRCRRSRHGELWWPPSNRQTC